MSGFLRAGKEPHTSQALREPWAFPKLLRLFKRLWVLAKVPAHPAQKPPTKLGVQGGPLGQPRPRSHLCPPSSSFPAREGEDETRA